MEIEGATVLVTGANGFVGGRVAVLLAERGAHVRALVRRPGEAEILARHGIEEVAGDFTDPADAARACAGVDAIVHCAATAGDDLDAVRRVNRDGTATIAAAALEAGVEAFVHISTGSVYDREGVDVLDEDAPRRTTGDPYGLTKAEAEVEVERAIEEGLAATILRPPAVLGWGPTSTWGERFPSRLRSGDGLPWRVSGTTFSWVHVDDLAEAVALALTDAAARGRIYNVVGGQTTIGRYLGDLASWFADVDPPQLDDGADWEGTMPADRISDELGWRPAVGYEDGMAEAASRWAR